MLAVWAEVLKIDADQIGINDNFFEIGGHSLLATRVINKLRSGSVANVSLMEFFDNPTIAALSKSYIQGAIDPEGESGEASGDDREEFVI